MLSKEEIETYIEAVAQPIFKQNGYQNLEAKKLGVLRIVLLSRYQEGEIDRDTYKQLDSSLKRTMGIA